MKIRKLDRAQFTHAIQRGLGSAFLHAAHYGRDDDWVRDVVLDACLNDYTYDSQINGSRSEWLASIMDRLDLAFCAGPVIDALREAVHNGGKECAQLIELAVPLYERGFVQVREILFSMDTDRPEFPIDTYCRSLMRLFGTKGFMEMVRLVSVDDHYSFGWHYRSARLWSADENEFDEFVSRERRHNAELNSHMEAMESEDKRCPRKTKAIPLDIFLARVEAQTKNGVDGSIARRLTRVFSRCATDNELRALCRLIAKTDDESLLVRYFEVFTYDRPMPKRTDAAFAAARSTNSELRRMAMRVLENIVSPAVRTFGLQLLETGDEKDAAYGIDLLALNATAEDLDAVVLSLAILKDKDHCHLAGFATRKMSERLGETVRDALIWDAENNPCAHCRLASLERLIEWRVCPDVLLFEAQWDGDPDTQYFARSALA